MTHDLTRLEFTMVRYCPGPINDVHWHAPKPHLALFYMGCVIIHRGDRNGVVSKGQLPNSH